jgi:ubiquinone/menaquinone biosynthesis C-methylase UbiE
MSDTDKLFTGPIAEFYDTYLVPLIFESYADDLAIRTAEGAPRAVLETAAGSGVVTRALATQLAPDTRYVVSDLNQPMLDHAAKRQGTDDRIEWRQADALALPFDDASFDTIICQFGVMFYPDKLAGYIEAHRVLKPGGRYIFSVWDHIEANQFADIVTQAAAAVFPDDPPRFLARIPHGYHDTQIITDDLKKAGFTDIASVTLEKSSTAPSPRHPAIAYCRGTPLRNEIEARDRGRLDDIIDRAAEAIAACYGDGPVTAKIQAQIVTATL